MKLIVPLRGAIAPIASGNSGLAADFLDLALRKAQHDGAIALVLPLSAASGIWMRSASSLGTVPRHYRCNHCQRARYDDILFCRYGMAECLLVARRGGEQAEKQKATFVLRRKGFDRLVRQNCWLLR